MLYLFTIHKNSRKEISMLMRERKFLPKDVSAGSLWMRKCLKQRWKLSLKSLDCCRREKSSDNFQFPADDFFRCSGKVEEKNFHKNDFNDVSFPVSLLHDSLPIDIG